jgi:hypothetical protein
VPTLSELGFLSCTPMPTLTHHALAHTLQIIRHVMEDRNSRKIFLFLIINVRLFSHCGSPCRVLLSSA